MKELLNQIIKDRDQSAEKFKEKVAIEVLFEGKDPKEIVGAYQLASVHTLQMWVSQYNNKIIKMNKSPPFIIFIVVKQIPYDFDQKKK